MCTCLIVCSYPIFVFLAVVKYRTPTEPSTGFYREQTTEPRIRQARQRRDYLLRRQRVETE